MLADKREQREREKRKLEIEQARHSSISNTNREAGSEFEQDLKKATESVAPSVKKSGKNHSQLPCELKSVEVDMPLHQTSKAVELRRALKLSQESLLLAQFCSSVASQERDAREARRSQLNT